MLQYATKTCIDTTATDTQRVSSYHPLMRDTSFDQSTPVTLTHCCEISGVDTVNMKGVESNINSSLLEMSSDIHICFPYTNC